MQLERIVLDIKDFEPAGLACLGSGQPWVCLGKHLCGAATDFALLCMARCAVSPAEASSEASQTQQDLKASLNGQDQHSINTHQACTEEHKGHCQAQPRGSFGCQPQKESLQNGLCQQTVSFEQDQAVALGKAEATKSGLQGFGIATCCHHRCSWEHYVGRKFFQEHGMAEADFQLVSWMTGAHPHAAPLCFPSVWKQYLQGESCLLALPQEPVPRFAEGGACKSQCLGAGWAVCGHGRPPRAAASCKCEQEGSSDSDAGCSAKGGACLEGGGAADGDMVRLFIRSHVACPIWLLCARVPSSAGLSQLWHLCRRWQC